MAPLLKAIEETTKSRVQKSPPIFVSGLKSQIGMMIDLNSNRNYRYFIHARKRNAEGERVKDIAIGVIYTRPVPCSGCV